METIFFFLVVFLGSGVFFLVVGFLMWCVFFWFGLGFLVFCFFFLRKLDLTLDSNVNPLMNLHP